MKSDFDMMTMAELKQYVLEHRNDLAAFQALMDRVDAQPQDRVYGEVDPKNFALLLEQHRHRDRE
ncbi:DUF6887 family protein [Roseofilum casamattae]|uniref:Uncharacterized protein n=1 Tax=Roseofilum casamattae BLCC-M143 TaxID=3022442 RepID=A0ABT7BU23_9CYAN|nr:hypothetical protein [Roseofilum casamattae]MDJ1182683.1 hypothetical protein [Roseofilum casamattae BLCC-M143]